MMRVEVTDLVWVERGYVSVAETPLGDLFVSPLAEGGFGWRFRDDIPCGEDTRDKAKSVASGWFRSRVVACLSFPNGVG